MFPSARLSNSPRVSGRTSRIGATLPHAVRIFDVEIRRAISPDLLDVLTDEEADAADDDGYLGGNQLYQDIRGASWDDVRAMLRLETGLIEKIAAAEDPAAAEEDFYETRDLDQDFADGIHGLDVGVAAAAMALSALGATPFISCNAGSFGGTHVARFPYVAFYLSKAPIETLLLIAERAGVGLDAQEGAGRLYARSVLDLLKFADLAVKLRK